MRRISEVENKNPSFAADKRYNTLNHYYRRRFGGAKVCRVSLNGGMSCPNIKGESGGCIFCSEKGSGDFAGDAFDDLQTQFNKVKSTLDKKWDTQKYIAYFQANTNTYAPLYKLKELYEEALSIDNVVGLSVATRPDSIADDVLDYLTELNNRTFLCVELGLQSVYDKTLRLINRGHDLECFHNMYEKLKMRNIRVVVHIINGLPYETKEMMLNTAKYLSRNGVYGVKIHMLYVLKNTKLEQMYNVEGFHLLSREEYVDIVCDQLELLSPDTVIHRVTGDADPRLLIAPQWTLKKFCVMNEIDKELRRRDTYQGNRYFDVKDV